MYHAPYPQHQQRTPESREIFSFKNAFPQIHGGSFCNVTWQPGKVEMPTSKANVLILPSISAKKILVLEIPGI